jgi:hypothetical protein
LRSECKEKCIVGSSSAEHVIIHIILFVSLLLPFAAAMCDEIDGVTLDELHESLIELL